jgi:hypothetical protein
MYADLRQHQPRMHITLAGTDKPGPCDRDGAATQHLAKHPEARNADGVGLDADLTACSPNSSTERNRCDGSIQVVLPDCGVTMRARRPDKDHTDSPGTRRE